MRRVWPAFLAFLLLTAACAGERPTLDDSAAREVESIEASASADSSGSETAVDERPVLRLAVSDGWSIDPADAGPASVTNRVIADLLYEGLTAIDDGGQPRPGLAERWFISDDRRTWTFALSGALTDGAGDLITARDVKTSLERIAARGGADQAATALTVIAGWSDRMEGIAGGVAGISAPDPTTLVVRLNSPFELLPNVLASPAFGITGETDSGLRTTGEFTATDDPAVFVARSGDQAVRAVELVNNDDGPAGAIRAGAADWGVLAIADSSSELDADITRQPLDLEVAIVARSPIKSDRLGLLGALEPLLLATAVEGLTGRTVPSSGDLDAPAVALVDVPDGSLSQLGSALVDQLESAGVEVLVAASDAEEFAARVAGGQAVLFPIVMAGGTGPASAVLRLGVPGASDDVFGPHSETREELAQAVVTELDSQQRTLFVQALEKALVDDGFLLPIGRFEVRVAIAKRLTGLRHRADGTLDTSGIELAAG